MKKVIKPLLILTITFLFTACFKENHSVRLKNGYSSRINTITIGSAQIESVNPGETSGYKSINTGDFSISGTTSSGEQISGSGSISGKGKHKWTVTMNSSGSLNMTEDK
jgi:hypothetical protein